MLALDSALLMDPTSLLSLSVCLSVSVSLSPPGGSRNGTPYLFFRRLISGRWQEQSFMPHGVPGLLDGAVQVFYAYIGSLSWTATLVFSNALRLSSDLCNPEIGRVVATTIPISAISITSCKALNYGTHAFVT